MDDKMIIDLFFNRSENAINETDLKYGKNCLKLSFNILNNIKDAEECVNDSYLGLWNAIPPATPNPFSTYLYKIVRNISLNCYRRNSAWKRNGEYDLSVEELTPYLSSDVSVESIIESAELKKYIEHFLTKLSLENRVIFIRRYWFFDSYQDIAERMGMSQKNVSVRLARIRKELKKFLEESGFLK